ncbi:THC0290_0291 family protein [Aureibaculum conchae]|uniref:THC0290_0291 family protein n=1 Tax=Aureibaculum sp. 2308TA14-22 TaxID=3108392 RepID=UPI0033912598
MKRSYKLLTLIMFFSLTGAFAQVEFSHEFGITTGPVTMQTDYGERHHLPSSTATSFGAAVVHYLSFYGSNYNWRNGASYFSDHFKLKTEVSYYFNNSLEHKGRYVADGSNNAELAELRAMKGKTKSINFGTALEYYFKNLEDYGLLFNDDDRFAPYISAGIQFNMFTPELTSDLGDWMTNPSVLPQKWQDEVYVGKQNALSMTLSAGTRYKLNNFDLVLDARWQYFFTDKFDGLDAKDTSSKFNDTLIYFSVGVVFDMETFARKY